MADKKKEKKELTPRQVIRRKRKDEKLKKKLKLSVPVPEGLKKSWERENRAYSIRKKLRESKLAALPEKRKVQAQRIEKYEQEYMKIKSDRHNKM